MQSEWVFPTENARAHDASVTLVINIITQRPLLLFVCLVCFEDAAALVTGS